MRRFLLKKYERSEGDEKEVEKNIKIQKTISVMKSFKLSECFSKNIFEKIKEKTKIDESDYFPITQYFSIHLENGNANLTKRERGPLIDIIKRLKGKERIPPSMGTIISQVEISFRKFIKIVAFKEKVKFLEVNKIYKGKYLMSIENQKEFLYKTSIETFYFDENNIKYLNNSEIDSKDTKNKIIEDTKAKIIENKKIKDSIKSNLFNKLIKLNFIEYLNFLIDKSSSKIEKIFEDENKDKYLDDLSKEQFNIFAVMETLFHINEIFGKSNFGHIYDYGKSLGEIYKNDKSISSLYLCFNVNKYFESYK